MYVYIYIYIYVYIYIHTYIHIHMYIHIYMKVSGFETLANFLEFQHSSKVAECTMTKTNSQQTKRVISLPRMRVDCFSLTREDQGEAELSNF